MIWLLVPAIGAVMLIAGICGMFVSLVRIAVILVSNPLGWLLMAGTAALILWA